MDGLFSMLAFCVLIALTVALIRPLQTELIVRIDRLKLDILTMAEKSLGRSISYESISPSFFRTLKINGLTITEADGRVLLRAQTINIHYEFLRLFSKDPFGAVTGIGVQGAQVDYDTVADRDLAGRFGGTGSRGGEVLGLGSPGTGKLAVTITGLSLRVTDPAGSARIADGSLEATLTDGRLKFKAAGALDLVLSDPMAGIDRCRTNFRISADTDTSFTDADLSLRLRDASTRLFDLKSLNLQLRYRDGAVEITKVQDKLPLDLSVSYDSRTGMARGSFSCDGFEAANLFKFEGPLSSYAVWLSTLMTGSVDVSYDTVKGNLDYSCSLKANLPEGGTPYNVKFSLDAKGDLRSVDITALSVDSSLGSGSFSGNIDLTTMLPSGRLSLSGLQLADGKLPLSGDFLIDRSAGTAILYSDRMTIAGFVFRNLDAVFYPRQNSFDFSIRAGFASGKLAEGPDTTSTFSGEAIADSSLLPIVKIDGGFAFSPKPFFEGSIDLENLTLADLYGMTKPFVSSSPVSQASGALGDFVINAEVFISTDFTHFAYNAPRFVIADSRKDGNYGIFSMAGNERQVALQQFTVFWNDQKLDGSLNVDFARMEEVNFSSTFHYANSSYAFDGLLLNGRNLAVKGKYGLNVSASFASDGVSFSMAADAIPIPLPTSTPELKLAIRGEYRNPDDWKVLMDSVQISQINRVLNSVPHLSFSGSVSPSGGTLSDIELLDQYSHLSGSADFDWNLSDPFSMRLSGAMKDGDGTENYSVELGIAGKTLSGGLTFVDSPIGRFSNTPISGGVSGNARVGGTLDSPTASFSVATRNALYQKNTVTFKASGTAGVKRITLTGVTIAYVTDRVENGSLDLDFKTGRARASGDYAGMFLDNPVSLSFSTDAAFSIPEAASPGSAGILGASGLAAIAPPSAGKTAVAPEPPAAPPFDSFTANLGIRRLVLAGKNYRDWNLSVKREKSALTITEPDKDEIAFSLLDSGDFTVRARGPIAFNGTARGRVADGRIDLAIQAERVDFAFFWPLFRIGVVGFDSADLSGSVSIRGSVADPEFYGTVLAENVVVKVPDFVTEKFGPLSMPIVFNEKTFTIASVPLKSKSATGMFSGRFVFERWVPDTYQLSISVDPLKPIHVATTISGINVDGNGSANLGIDGDPQRILLTGAITLENSTVTLLPAPAEPVPSQASDNDMLQVRLVVNTGKKVEFVWPSKQFPVFRGIADTNDHIQFAFDGPSQAYTIQGAADIKGGSVFYVERNFYLREGRIVFNENEDRFDPVVSLKAEIRERNDEGPVTVQLIADNNRLSAFNPRFTSDPPLSNLAILNLIGANLIGESATGSASIASALRATSDIPTQFYVIRVLEQNVRDALNLDMFSLRTQFIQNFVIDATGVARTTPLDTRYSLGKYFDNTAVYVGKYLGNDLFFQSMVQLQMEPSVVGSSVYDKPTIDAELGLEFRMPFFTLAWELLPKHPENLFLTDNSFTFSWKYSY
jgi:translocation and assembly module TamB